ncbi:MAG TPA: protein-L-isoaspartate(D-aspartate) O-methyltransferase [Myxococcaceae bacterium]|nr:protein-L-isoaspartate(D-aspartate) O-methyltransferase [Myxococcaceae bacterium]
MGDADLARELSRRGISDRRVLEAIASLDRSRFVPATERGNATSDQPLPIGHGQTISQPYIVGFMSQALDVQPGERILEIGTGSGYQAAVLAKMGADVYSVEIVPELAAQARERLQQLGLERINLKHGDGAHGWPEAAPFDAIVLTAAPKHVPQDLLAQVRVGGRLLAPVGEREELQQLVLVRRTADGGAVERLLSVRFVPLTRETPRLC